MYIGLVASITGTPSDLNTGDTCKPVPVPLTHVSPFLSISVLEISVALNDGMH